MAAVAARTARMREALEISLTVYKDKAKLLVYNGSSTDNMLDISKARLVE